MQIINFGFNLGGLQATVADIFASLIAAAPQEVQGADMFSYSIAIGPSLINSTLKERKSNSMLAGNLVVNAVVLAKTIARKLFDRDEVVVLAHASVGMPGPSVHSGQAYASRRTPFVVYHRSPLNLSLGYWTLNSRYKNSPSRGPWFNQEVTRGRIGVDLAAQVSKGAITGPITELNTSEKWNAAMQKWCVELANSGEPTLAAENSIAANYLNLSRRLVSTKDFLASDLPVNGKPAFGVGLKANGNVPNLGLVRLVTTAAATGKVLSGTYLETPSADMHTHSSGVTSTLQVKSLATSGISEDQGVLFNSASLGQTPMTPQMLRYFSPPTPQEKNFVQEIGVYLLDLDSMTNIQRASLFKNANLADSDGLSMGCIILPFTEHLFEFELIQKLVVKKYFTGPGKDSPKAIPGIQLWISSEADLLAINCLRSEIGGSASVKIARNEVLNAHSALSKEDIRPERYIMALQVDGISSSADDTVSSSNDASSLVETADRAVSRISLWTDQ